MESNYNNTFETPEITPTNTNNNNNKTNNETNYCSICYDNNNDNNIIQLENCSHILCKECLLKWIETERYFTSTGIIRCPCHNECHLNISYNNLKDIMNNNDFNKLQDDLFEYTLLSNQNYSKCKINDNCNYIFQLPSQNDNDDEYCKTLHSLETKKFKPNNPIYISNGSYYIIPGKILTKMDDGNYEVELYRFTANIPPLYTTERDNPVFSPELLNHSSSILYFGALVRYNYNEHYVIGVRKVLQPESNEYIEVYDLKSPSSNVKVFGISHQNICLFQIDAVKNKDNFYCPLCNSSGCRQCKMKHESDVTCMEYLQEREAYIKNLSELKQFRQEYLTSIFNFDNISNISTHSLNDENKNDNENNLIQKSELQLTADLLYQLDIRICRRCKNGVEKSSGCNKLMCRCGYKFCYQCGIEDAQCKCTPSSHTYIDNTPR